MAKREDELDAAFPLSDVGYFGAEIDSYGKLTGVPGRDKLAFFSGRVHLVTACNSRGLAHFALEPGSRTRRQLVADLLEASRNFDGLQIDFELIPPLDGDNFRSFLGELRQGLGGKTLSVALPARTRAIPNDVFDYRKILPLVDRILVMAYDEHWSTSEPGPVASIPWCRDVAAYALETIGPEKLIMGLPFYGRSWGSVNGNRAFYHSGIRRIGRENRVTESHREDGVPTFSYETTMKVTVYYDDDYSLSTRLQMYRGMGVRSVGFWSIGQETPAIWSLLELER
ncbi:MAG: glycoside hydrolase [Treponema sp.]|nr:glycoside hydrolase [Treponema sp.]